MFSRDMKQLKSARRFQGAEKVRIACLKKGEQRKSGRYIGYTGIGSSADATVVSLAVPFASSFPSLKEIQVGFFGNAVIKSMGPPMITSGGGFIADSSLNSSRSLIQSLTLSFCGAYESGLIPPNTVVKSCFATCGESKTEHGCEFCARCVACFPPKDLALSFQHRYTCILPKNFLATIARRDGGKDVLESKEFLLSLFHNRRCAYCEAFVDIVEEFGLVPATISMDEARELISDLEKDSLDYHGAVRKIKESHIEALRSLGVPI